MFVNHILATVVALSFLFGFSVRYGNILVLLVKIVKQLIVTINRLNAMRDMVLFPMSSKYHSRY